MDYKPLHYLVLATPLLRGNTSVLIMVSSYHTLNSLLFPLPLMMCSLCSSEELLFTCQTASHIALGVPPYMFPLATFLPL